MKRSFPFNSKAIWPPAGLVAVFVIFYAIVDAGKATAFGPNLSCLAGCSCARDINRRGALARARFPGSAGIGIWIRVSGCNDSFAGVHPNVDTLSASGSALARAKPSSVEGSADDWHHREFDRGHLVRVPQKPAGFSLETTRS